MIPATIERKASLTPAAPLTAATRSREASAHAASAWASELVRVLLAIALILAAIVA